MVKVPYTEPAPHEIIPILKAPSHEQNAPIGEHVVLDDGTFVLVSYANTMNNYADKVEMENSTSSQGYTGIQTITDPESNESVDVPSDPDLFNEFLRTGKINWSAIFARRKAINSPKKTAKEKTESQRPN